MTKSALSPSAELGPIHTVAAARLNQVLHINVPEGKFIASHGEFDPL
jgi:hypothetical protein